MATGLVQNEVVTGLRPTAEASPRSQLSQWGSAWRYAVMIVVALVVYVIFLGAVLERHDVNPDLIDDQPLWIQVLPLSEVILGLATIGALPFRRRWPLLIAVMSAALMSFSATAIAGAALAATSNATRRRPRSLLVVGIVWLCAGLILSAWSMRPGAVAWVIPVIMMTTYALSVTIGLYVGARRDLIASLRTRAHEAEREAALRVAAARATERTLIAREMHDVLAHRISLIAVHAGALDYRTDLSTERSTEAASLIRENARRALVELRHVLDVLGDRDERSPQPTLAQLEALLEETRQAGMRVTATVAARIEELPDEVSRCAYRVVQESVTNVRKHAPGAQVRLLIEGQPEVF
ncbi:sensor histidine kinase [Microbacterium amylolyticum]|uniref:sensor histidine kinase n=1 Tax=Microbacterium amylolyticum TaxID=936337 RepID=UPI00360B0353